MMCIQGPEETFCITVLPYHPSIIEPIRQSSDTNISFVGYPNSINQQCTMQCVSWYVVLPVWTMFNLRQNAINFTLTANDLNWVY